MNIKKTIVMLSIVFTSYAAAMPQISATKTTGGVWIKVTENGLPVASAVVNDRYVTDASGRVFVHNHIEFSKTINYKAVTPNGDELKTRLFIANQKNQ